MPEINITQVKDASMSVPTEESVNTKGTTYRALSQLGGTISDTFENYYLKEVKVKEDEAFLKAVKDKTVSRQVKLTEMFSNYDPETRMVKLPDGTEENLNAHYKKWSDSLDTELVNKFPTTDSKNEFKNWSIKDDTATQIDIERTLMAGEQGIREENRINRIKEDSNNILRLKQVGVLGNDVGDFADILQGIEIDSQTQLHLRGGLDRITAEKNIKDSGHSKFFSAIGKAELEGDWNLFSRLGGFDINDMKVAQQLKERIASKYKVNKKQDLTIYLDKFGMNVKRTKGTGEINIMGVGETPSNKTYEITQYAKPEDTEKMMERLSSEMVRHMDKSANDLDLRLRNFRAAAESGRSLEAPKVKAEASNLVNEIVSSELTPSQQYEEVAKIAYSELSAGIRKDIQNLTPEQYIEYKTKVAPRAIETTKKLLRMAGNPAMPAELFKGEALKVIFEKMVDNDRDDIEQSWKRDGIDSFRANNPALNNEWEKNAQTPGGDEKNVELVNEIRNRYGSASGLIPLNSKSDLAKDTQLFNESLLGGEKTGYLKTVGIINKWRQSKGENYSKYITELAKSNSDFPSEYAMVAMLADRKNPESGNNEMRNALNSINIFNKSKKEVTALGKEFQDGVKKSLAPYYSSLNKIYNFSEGVDANKAMESIISAESFRLIQAGQSQSDAINSSVNTFFGRHFETVKGGDSSVLIPKNWGVNSNRVSKALDRIQNDPSIAASVDFEKSNLGEDIKVPLSKGILNPKEALGALGSVIGLASEEGMHIALRSNDARTYPLIDNKGRSIVLRWEDINTKEEYRPLFEGVMDLFKGISNEVPKIKTPSRKPQSTGNTMNLKESVTHFVNIWSQIDASKEAGDPDNAKLWGKTLNEELDKLPPENKKQVMEKLKKYVQSLGD